MQRQYDVLSEGRFHVGAPIDTHSGVAMAAFDGKNLYDRAGTVLDEPVPAAEALCLAGLDFQVEKRPMYTTNAAGDELVEVPGRFAVVRTDTDRALGDVGPQYRVIQHADYLDVLDALADAGKVVPCVVGSFNDGQRAFLSARIVGNGGPIVVNGRDVSEKYVTAMNAHDGAQAGILFFHAVRLWCANVIPLAVRSARREGQVCRIRHSGDVATKLRDASRALVAAEKEFAEYQAQATLLAKQTLTDTVAQQYVQTIMPDPPALAEDVAVEAKNKRERAVARVERKRVQVLDLWKYGTASSDKAIRGTLWAAYQAVVEWADHVAGYKRSAEQRLRTGIWGSHAELKQRALHVALEYAQ